MLGQKRSGPLSRQQLMLRLLLWASMFCVAAILAGAETAITTLWPWKMKKLASEEGAKSPFRALEKDITKVGLNGCIYKPSCSCPWSLSVQYPN